MSIPYEISDFLVSLKLGIWQSGEVKEWGRVQTVLKIKDRDIEESRILLNTLTYIEKKYFLKKTILSYLHQPYFKGTPAIGVYLLDSYLLTEKKDELGLLKTYMVVICVGRLGIDKREYTYILKIDSYADSINFTHAIGASEKKRRRKSYFRR